MHVYDLVFTDGKECRHIVPDPQPTEQEELRITQAIFCGRLKSMTRIIAPPPEKLPWKRSGSGWRLGNFELERMPEDHDGPFIWRLRWPGEILYAETNDDVVAAVHHHWHLGI